MSNKAKPDKTYLIESLQYGRWIKLPLACMRECGPAVQTLGGLLDIAGRKGETFVTVAKIAQTARLKLKTARNHLTVLRNSGSLEPWVYSRGREKTSRGAPRRTCTIELSSTAMKAAKGDDASYGVLPFWACYFSKVNRMAWPTKAVLSLIMGRLMVIKSIHDSQGRRGEEWAVADEIMKEEPDRWKFSLDKVSDATGLCRDSIVKAKRELTERGIIRWHAPMNEKTGNTAAHLVPNRKFHVIETSTSEGRCTVEFREK